MKNFKVIVTDADKPFIAPIYCETFEEIKNAVRQLQQTIEDDNIELAFEYERE
jgi:hypothetical protein